jgi:flagellar biogenesis protein FliO
MNKIWTLEYAMRMFSTLSLLAGVGALLVFIKKRRNQESNKDSIRVLSSVSIGPKQKIVLIEQENIKILVGFTEHAVSVLSKTRVNNPKKVYQKEQPYEKEISSDVIGILELQKQKESSSSSNFFKKKAF